MCIFQDESFLTVKQIKDDETSVMRTAHSQLMLFKHNERAYSFSVKMKFLLLFSVVVIDSNVAVVVGTY